MHTSLHKFPLRILPCLSLLFLSHLAECSLYDQISPTSPPDNCVNNQVSCTIGHLSMVNSQKLFNMKLHGLLLWASMGVLMPLGILIMRFSSTRVEFHQTWHKFLFYLHAALQVLAALLVTAGAVLSIRNFENKFNNNHQRIGLALYGSVYLQVFIGFRRPNRGTKGRSAWYVLHWMLGTIITLVGILNIYTGLQTYHKKTSRSITLWTIIFTAQLSFMTIIYLFQDKWEYMQKQGMATLPTPADAPVPADNVESQKEVVNEAGGKSNALGTHFSKSNALKKLFQLT